MEGGQIFVVDGGFGFTKWLYGDKKGKVRSCYKRYGDEWLIGERALLETGSRYLRNVDELIEMYPQFVRYCEKEAGVEGRDVLVVGLPYTSFEEDVESGGVIMERLIRDLRSLGYEKVFVFPQGLGGIKWFLSGRPGFEGNVLGIDVGFNTVIVVLYSVKEKRIIVARTYYKRGIYDLTVSLLLPKIRKFLGDRTITPIELNYLMEHKKLQMGFDVIDLAPEVEESVEEYVGDLLKFILRDIKSGFGLIAFDVVVFMGGGANWLKGKVESQKVEVVVLDEPEYANAYGFRVKAEEVLRQESEG